MKKICVSIFLMLCYINQLYGIDAATLSKYPHVLVTDSYDILDEHDLDDDRYGLTLGPLLYDQGRNSHYCYWKCFKTTTFKAKCRYLEFNDSWNQHTGDLSLTIVDDNRIVNEYGMRRALGMQECRQELKQWKKLIKNEEYVCLNGTFVGSEIGMHGGQEQKIYGWVFNKLKTKKGCKGYFGC